MHESIKLSSHINVPVCHFQTQDSSRPPKPAFLDYAITFELQNILQFVKFQTRDIAQNMDTSHFIQHTSLISGKRIMNTLENQLITKL